MPPPVADLLAGTLIGTFILKFDKRCLINVPDSLEHGIVFPQFGAAFTHAALLLPLAYLVVTLLLIDTTKCPWRRSRPWTTSTPIATTSPTPARTLLAMGVSDGASSVLSGLTIIPGIVKSTANVLAGGGRSGPTSTTPASC